MQVYSRVVLVWAVIFNFPFVAKSAGYSSMLIAWSVTEVVRYGFFVFTLSGYSPGILLWLRYNLFFILYPLGAGSEWWLMYKSIPSAKNIRQEYAWFLQLMLFIWIPSKITGLIRGLQLTLLGFYILFTHMLKQRKKILRGKQVQKAE